jgi:hypothetical protein
VVDEKKSWSGFDGNPGDRRIDTGNLLAMVYAGEVYLNRHPFPSLEAVSRLLRLVHRIPRAVLSGMNARATGGLSGDGGQ